MAFKTHARHFEYLIIMPFRLPNKPVVFQKLVNEVLGDMLNKFVYVYVDDILIYFEIEHTQHVRAVP